MIDTLRGQVRIIESYIAKNCSSPDLERLIGVCEALERLIEDTERLDDDPVSC